MVLGWIENIDMSLVTSILVIVNYIGKYCSNKKKFDFYQELLQSIQPYTNNHHAFNSVIVDAPPVEIKLNVAFVAFVAPFAAAIN